MNATVPCPACGASIQPGTSPCPECESTLAGAREIVSATTRGEAVIAHDLLLSAGFHPTFAYEDETDVPHPIEPEEPFTRSAGLMVPVVSNYVVYVPEAEADDARRVLEDAGHALDDADSEAGPGEDDRGARSPRPGRLDQD